METQDMNTTIKQAIEEIMKRINEATAEAIKNNIEVNAIAINPKLIKVPEMVFWYEDKHQMYLPPMICGLEILPPEIADNVLPEDIGFALTKSYNPNNLANREYHIEKRIREERAEAVEDALLLVIEKVSEHARGLKHIRVNDVVDIIDSIIDEQLEEK